MEKKYNLDTMCHEIDKRYNLAPEDEVRVDALVMALNPVYKPVKVLKPFCPTCKEMLCGENSMMLPYKCKCGTWKRDLKTMKFNVGKP